MAINLSMSFVDFPWRYAHVPQAETQLRLYQNMAHGAPPAYRGGRDDDRRTGRDSSRPGRYSSGTGARGLYVGQTERGPGPAVASDDTPPIAGSSGC